MWAKFFTGSATERAMNCPASIAMSAKLTEGKKKDADKGTQKHSNMARILQGMPDATPPDEHEKACLDHMESIVGYKRQQETVVSNMQGFSRVLVWETFMDVKADVVEERLPLLNTGGGGIDRFVIKGNTCYLFDYKFGYGIPIYAGGNAQLAFYACAIKEKYPQVTKFQAWILQPTREGVFDDTPNFTSWDFGWQTVAKWKRDIEAAIIEVEKAETIRAGKWCRFCKARAGCPAHISYAKRAEMELAEHPDACLPAIVETWLPETIPNVARIFRLRERMTTWFNKAEEFLLQAAIANPEFEKDLNANGLETYTKKSDRKWRSNKAPQEKFLTEAQIAAEITAQGGDPYKPLELIGIGAAEKQKIDTSKLTHKPAGAKGIRVIK